MSLKYGIKGQIYRWKKYLYETGSNVCVPLRTIKPLNDKSWRILIQDLEKGQTEEEAKFLQEALEDKLKIKTDE